MRDDEEIYLKLAQDSLKKKNYQLAVNQLNAALETDIHFTAASQLKRTVLYEWGISLKQRVEHERFEGQNFFTRQFDEETIKLLVALIEHDSLLASHSIEEAIQRKRTLGNICLTVAWLSKDFTDSYAGQESIHDGRSIWRDLIVLGLSTFEPTNALYSHRISVDDNQLLTILTQDLSQFLLPHLRELLNKNTVHKLDNSRALKAEIDKKMGITKSILEGDIESERLGLTEKTKQYKEHYENAKKTLDEANKRIDTIERELPKISEDIKYEEESIQQEQDKGDKKSQHVIDKCEREILKLKVNLEEKKTRLIEWRKKAEDSKAKLELITEQTVKQQELELDQKKQELERLRKQKNELTQEIDTSLNELGSYRMPHIFYLVNKHREEKALKKILDFSSPAGSTEPIQEDILRRLVVIGEQLTKKNLTVKTLNFLIKKANELHINIDWGLLVRIRNKLAHPEWDIYSRQLFKYMSKYDLTLILKEDLEKINQVVKALLTSDEWKNSSDNYYDNFSSSVNVSQAGMGKKALVHIAALEQAIPDINLYGSRSGQQFIQHQQLLIIQMIFEQIDTIQAILQSLNNTNNEALEYALKEDCCETVDDNEQQSATQLFERLLDLHKNRLYWQNIYNLGPSSLYQPLLQARQQIAQYHRPFRIMLPRPPEVQAGHMNFQRVVVNIDYNILAQNAINYGNLCDIYRELESNPPLLRKLEYHLSLIYAYLKLIDDETIKPFLSELETTEFRFHRNFMDHGETYGDLMPQTAFHVHYAAKYLLETQTKLLEIKNKLTRQTLSSQPKSPQALPLLQQEAVPIADPLVNIFALQFASDPLFTQVIGGFNNAAQLHFKYSNYAFMQSEQRQVFLCYLAKKYNLDVLKVHNHLHDNPALNAIEFQNGIVMLPELITTDGSDGLKVQFKAILQIYKNMNKPIYLCINRGGYHYTTLVIIPGADNTATYRYIDPLRNNHGEWISLSPSNEQGLQAVLAEEFSNGISVHPDINYQRQQNYQNDHNNECGFHNVYNTIYMLLNSPSANVAKMKVAMQIPGNNLSDNGGIDPHDAEFYLRPFCRQLFQQIQVCSPNVSSNHATTNNNGVTGNKADKQAIAQLPSVIGSPVFTPLPASLLGQLVTTTNNNNLPAINKP